MRAVRREPRVRQAMPGAQRSRIRLLNSPGMDGGQRLAAARERAAAAGVSLKAIEGSSYDLQPDLGRFRLVTLGRSFHWMDRGATLVLLDRMVERGGGIALFGDKRIEIRDVDWRPLVERLQEELVPARAVSARASLGSRSGAAQRHDRRCVNRGGRGHARCGAATTARV